MTPSPVPQPKADKKLTLSSHINGHGLRFEVGDDENAQTYILRPPSPSERDEADRVETTSKRYLRMTDPEVKELADMSPPTEEVEFMRALLKFEEKVIREAAEGDEDLEALERRVNSMYENLSNRTAADSILSQYGRKRRNRYLAKKLLCDEEGKAIKIEDLPIPLQDITAEKAEEYWDHMGSLDFLSG